MDSHASDDAAPVVIDPEAMRAAADEASEFLKSLGNRHRLVILWPVVEGEN